MRGGQPSNRCAAYERDELAGFSCRTCGFLLLLRARHNRPNRRATNQPNDPAPAKIAHGVAPPTYRPRNGLVAQSVCLSSDRLTGGGRVLGRILNCSEST